MTDLCERYVTPDYVKRCDDEQRYPDGGNGAPSRRQVGRVWRSPDKYGGAGGTAADLALTHRTLARHGFAIAQAYYSLWILGANAIAGLGNDEQKAANGSLSLQKGSFASLLR